MAIYGRWFVFTVTVPTVGRAERFPNWPVDDGVLLVIRALAANTDVAYLANSPANTGNASLRLTLSPGEAIGLALTNADLVYAQTAVANEGFEVFGESNKVNPENTLPSLPDIGR